MTAMTMHASEAALRATLTALADRYEAIAEKATTPQGWARAVQIRKAAGDVRFILATGRLPLYLMSNVASADLCPAEDIELVDEESAS